MKKLIVTAMMVGLSFAALAQGTITFQNDATRLVQQTDGVTTTSSPVGTHVAFYYSVTPVAAGDGLNAALHFLNGGTIAPVPGRFSLGTYTTGTDAAPGSTIYAEVRGWTGNYATWDLAAAAAASGTLVYMGYSSVFSMGTGGAGAPPSPPISLTTIPAFTGVLLTIPEPTTFALAGLGAAALLIFRRRS